jgi:hypothetical protein
MKDLYHNPAWFCSSVLNRWNAAKKSLRSQGRKYAGLRVITSEGEHFIFPKGDKNTQIALKNMSRLATKDFRVFLNMNDEVAVQETRRLPFYHLV